MGKKRTLWAAFTLAAALVTAVPAAANANPRDTGCPEGAPLLEVAVLTAQGYQAPLRVDAAGNGDGFICGHPRPIKQCEREVGGPCPVPVFYNFFDNVLPRGQNK